MLDVPNVDVSFNSASITTNEDVDRSDFDAPWADESNGLCGAGIPGVLELTTGTHTGYLPFRTELHDSEPAVDPRWEEVVEVSFTTTSDEAFLIGMMGGNCFPFPLPRDDYRVRYCARAFGEAHDSDEAGDSYLLQFWSAPPEPGRILVQTSAEAAYRHRTRRTLTPQEQEEDDRRDAAEREERARARWGDRIPNERLRATLDKGLWLGRLFDLNGDLEFALAEADDTLRRRIAAWGALRSLDASGLIALREFEPAVAALRRGEPAPPPFDDPASCWTLFGQANPPRTNVPAPPDGEHTRSQQEWALSTIFCSADSDSLVSVLEIVVCLAYVHGQDGYRQAFADLRAAFPEL